MGNEETSNDQEARKEHDNVGLLAMVWQPSLYVYMCNIHGELLAQWYACTRMIYQCILLVACPYCIPGVSTAGCGNVHYTSILSAYTTLNFVVCVY